MFPQVGDKYINIKKSHWRIPLNKPELGDFDIFSISMAWMDMKLLWFESEQKLTQCVWKHFVLLVMATCDHWLNRYGG